MKLIAFILPAPFFSAAFGTHNGYVAIPPEHPCYGHGYSESPIVDLDVHGGITYSEPVLLGEVTFMGKFPVNPAYIGTRALLLDKAEYITEEKYIPDDWWILGFDTCHYFDADWDKERVIEETLKLKKQLEELIDKCE